MRKIPDLVYQQDPFHSEWTGHMAKIELDYRKEVPEGNVVDKLEAWIEAYGYVPAADSLKLWQELEEALKKLYEERAERIRIAQLQYDARFGRMNPYVPEVQDEDDKELQEIYAG